MMGIRLLNNLFKIAEHQESEGRIPKSHATCQDKNPVTCVSCQSKSKFQDHGVFLDQRGDLEVTTIYVDDTCMHIEREREHAIEFEVLKCHHVWAPTPPLSYTHS